MVTTPIGLPPVMSAANASLVRPGAASKSPAGEQSEFSSFLASSFTEMSRSLRVGESAAGAGLRGDMPLQEVVESVMHAERQLHVALALRDKVVSAYLEISRMTI